MQKILFLLIVCLPNLLISQEMGSDLFQTWQSNTLSQFNDSPYKKMTVTTSRAVKGELFIELATTYRKAKIKLNRINFSIDYTAHYIVEARKKSNGKYDLDNLGRVKLYERTDIGYKSKILGTYYNRYAYEKGVLKVDRMRYKEYVNAGAVEMDTVVTHDSLLFSVYQKKDTIFQKDQLSENTESYYVIRNGKLIVQKNSINDYEEEHTFSYNSSGRLEMIVILLKSVDGKSAKNVFKLTYNADGLISKSEYYDKKNALVEVKEFTYK